jgi:putative peptide zinc metalloprotease protein
MDKSFYSSSWYRVADLKPRLRSHAYIHRQHFRGGLWYVLQDRTSGRFHRFTPAAYLVISLMNGERTVEAIWQLACRRLGDDALTQDEIIRLLSQLYQADVLRADIAPDFDEMSWRAEKVRRRKLIAGLANPLALRLPLLDPDAFLNATMPFVRPVFSWLGACIFIGVVGYAVILAGIHWSALTENIADRVFAAKSLLLLVLCYPFVKAVHELGHAYAIKRWGGEVHELGMMFLVFMPVPYVDASSSAAFREKWQRAIVGSAGIAVELMLAAIALFIWLNVEDGLVRAFAFNVMLIGGVSTILFNGNPLLRFDGYYVLSDVLEIPNLGDRAKRYLGYLMLRNAFGVKDAISPVTAPGEPFWFIVYGVASFIYRIFIVAAIVLLVATKFFIIGVLIAVWSTIMMIGVPAAKSLWSLIRNPAMAQNRRRAFLVCAGTLAVVAAALLLLPLPYRTVAEGVVWPPGEPAVFAGTDGIVVAVLREPNTPVVPGDPLLQMEDPLIAAKVRVLEATLKELRLRRDSVYATDPLQTRLLEEQINRTESDLALHRQRQSYLTVRSPATGRFILRRPSDMIGKFVHKGEQVGYVAVFDRPVVLAIVNEDAADLVRKRAQGVHLRRADHIRDVRRASVLREVPNINDRLPSAALSTAGGGEVMLDPRDPKNLRTLTKSLHLEIQPAEPMPVTEMGGRAYVRFDHGSEPLAWRLYRDLRQLFLKRFNV